MTGQFGSRRTPDEITVLRDQRCVQVRFDDGACFALPFELLRVESPSAEVQGHGPGQKQVVAGRMHVAVIGAEPVGHYAVKLIFDDLHDSGIYTWDYLYFLGQNQDRIWADYLDQIQKAGLSRDPAQNPPPALGGKGCGGGKGGCA